MSRITEDIFQHLVNNTKSPDIPGLQKDVHSPFTPRNKYSIGFIDRIVAYNTDALYMIEVDGDMKGFFLYRNGELKSPDNKMEIPKAHLDPHTTDMEAMIDVADCSIELPDQIQKLTEAIRVKTLGELFAKEPDLDLCINKKEIDNGKGFFRRLFEISTFGIFK